MEKNTLIFILIIIHIIGAIFAMLIHYKDGTFERALEHGDGFRHAKPSDVLFMDCVVWEVELLLFVMELIEKMINNFFDKLCKKERQ